MTTKEHFFPSKYLNASVLGKPTEAVIEALREEDVQTEDGLEKKPVLHLKGLKPLILNVTNWKSIAKQFGDDSTKWPGKTIRLVVVEVDAFGEVKPAVRVAAKAA